MGRHAGYNLVLLTDSCCFPQLTRAISIDLFLDADDTDAAKAAYSVDAVDNVDDVDEGVKWCTVCVKCAVGEGSC